MIDSDRHMEAVPTHDDAPRRYRWCFRVRCCWRCCCTGRECVTTPSPHPSPPGAGGERRVRESADLNVPKLFSFAAKRDGLIKSPQNDGFIKSSRCKAAQQIGLAVLPELPVLR